jgi:exoribonuclease-2
LAALRILGIDPGLRTTGFGVIEAEGPRLHYIASGTIMFDDAGKFLAGRVMSEAESSVQIELDSGKRVKVKAANVLLRFDKPAPAELMPPRSAGAEIDLDLAWEFAPEDEFGFADLARDYFDAKAGVDKQAAALFRLFEAPHYFRRAGKGRFRKAPEETVKAALLGIERKKQVAAQIEAWAGELAAGQCPPPVREQLYRILFKPDKNAPEYKAVVEAARRAQRSPLDLLHRPAPSTAPTSSTGGASCSSSSQGHRLPGAGGAGHQGRAAAGRRAGLLDRRFGHHRDRRRAVGAGPGQRHVVFGVHIAAPGLAISPIQRSTRWRASACPPSTCRAGS